MAALRLNLNVDAVARQCVSKSWIVSGNAERISARSSKDAAVTDIRDPESFVMPRVKWGRADVLFTPAYWASQAQMRADTHRKDVHRLGSTFREEVVACLLGGYGIPADVGLAAFRAIKSSGLLERADVTEHQIVKVLNSPLRVGGNRYVRYRFARQKADYVASFLNQFGDLPEALAPRQLRDWLMQFDGIGMKTASWITRNWLDSDEVAIIDIHVFRAGVLAGYFSLGDDVNRDYREMERRYLTFAKAIQVRASLLDALIWDQMRRASRLVLRLLRDYNTTQRWMASTHRNGGRQCQAVVAAEAAAGEDHHPTRSKNALRFSSERH